MSKERIKNLIKLIIVCAVAVVVSVLAVVFVLQDNAYAWFAKNTLVSANGMEVAIQVDESKVNTVSYFKYKEKSDNSYTFEISDKNEMDTFSSLYNNVYQFIVKINLTDVDSVTVVAQVLDYTFQTESGTATKKYLGADDADDLTEEGNSLSSVVAFEIYYSDSSNISETIDSEGTTTEIELSSPNSSEYSFVNNDKTLNSSVSLGETHTFTDSGTDKAVYIVIKYNVNAITEVFGRNIGNKIFETSETVKFDVYDFGFSVS